MAVFITIVTAINSIGFYQFDEHFQILEFAGLKSGSTNSTDLSWEFHEKARSAIMPCAAHGIIAILRSVSIESPFVQAQIIRLLTGILILIIIFYFTESIKHKVKEENHLLLYLFTYFLYFMPYFFVRFSSETLSAGFFLLGLSCIIRITEKQERQLMWFMAGLCIGLAFLMRFQSAFFSVGLLVWLIAVNKTKIKQLAVFIGGGALVLVIGLLIDHYFYEQWVFSAYNYFRVNILEDRPAYWGTSGYLYYFNLLFRLGTMDFLNIFLLLFLVLYFWFNPKTIITFCIIPFILIHFMVPHKELRFLFPVFFFIPFISTISIQKIKDSIKTMWLLNSLKFLFIPFALLNFTALILNALKPADGQPLVYEYLSKHYKSDSLTIYYVEEKWNFLECQAGLEMNFYKNSKHTIKSVDPSQLNTLPKGAFVLTNGNARIENAGLKKTHSVMPEWLAGLNQLHLFRIKNCDWVIYEK